MINPAGRLSRCRSRINQRRTTEKGQEIASLHRGILFLDALQ
jgi:hypothetical protein